MEKNQKLYDAAAEQRWQDVTTLIKQGALLTYPMLSGSKSASSVSILPFPGCFSTALHYIAFFGKLGDVVPSDLSVDVDGIIENKGGNIHDEVRHVTPLIAAVKAGKIENARWLIQRGADVNAIGETYSNRGYRVLNAVSIDDEVMFRLLIFSGANVWCQDKVVTSWCKPGDQSGRNAIIEKELAHYKTWKNDELDQYQKWITESAKLSFEKSKLRRVSSNGNLRSLQLEGLKTDDYKVLDTQKNGLLHVAVMKDRQDNVKFLLDKCDVNLTNENGDTPLHLCVQKNNLKIATLLLENPATASEGNTKCDVSIGNNSGNSALHVAVDNNN